VPAGGRLVEKFGVAPFSVTGVAAPSVGVPGAEMQTLALQVGGGLEKVRTLGEPEELLLLLPLGELLLLLLLLEGMLLDELLLELEGVLLLEAVAAGAAPPPPPPEEQADNRTRTEKEEARRNVPLDDAFMSFVSSLCATYWRVPMNVP